MIAIEARLPNAFLHRTRMDNSQLIDEVPVRKWATIRTGRLFFQRELAAGRGDGVIDCLWGLDAPGARGRRRVWREERGVGGAGCDPGTKMPRLWRVNFARLALRSA